MYITILVIPLTYKKSIIEYEGKDFLRVISGKVRGKKLISLDGKNTRPTLDRIKESLFNIIQFDLKEAVVLDLFAGSGALGIEAISRGAREVTFCDNSVQAIGVIRKNLENTTFIEQSEIINKDYTLALKKIAESNKKFDIIFIDPPYETNFAVNAWTLVLELELLNKEGIVVVETDKKTVIDEIQKKGESYEYDIRKYGRVTLAFIRKG